MNTIFLSALAGFLTAAMVLRADLRRRRLSLKHAIEGGPLNALDMACPSLGLGVAAGRAVKLALDALSSNGIHLSTPGLWAVIVNGAIFAFVWREGRRQIQFQRPRGIVFAEWFILSGILDVLTSIFFPNAYPAVPRLPSALVGAAAVIVGVVVIAKIVPPFVKKGSEYHRILEHLVEEGEFVQQEYASPTPECPNPRMWTMVDSQTTELEVLDFLKCLVTTLKPSLIVETGTFLGYGTIKLAEGAKANGFGKVVTIEYDPVIYAKARERIEAAGVSNWVECRNESSLETRIDGTIDFYFSDSALAIREQEIRRLLPQVDPDGLIAIHDASSQFEIVREAALRMEREGLLSVVLLSTPRGLVLAQKRAGRA
jgi:predicted O-methyltransferase YrrM